MPAGGSREAMLEEGRVTAIVKFVETGDAKGVAKGVAKVEEIRADSVIRAESATRDHLARDHREEAKADRRGAIDHELVVPSDWRMDRGDCGRDVQRKE